MTRAYLQRYYDGRVHVEYADMADPKQYEQYKTWVDQVKSGYRYYPLVFIDGELKLSGSADPYQIIYALQSVMQVEQA
jgi:disulfide oxidoreductase YuzD